VPKNHTQRLSKWAEIDLAGIAEYTLDTWGEPQTAKYCDLLWMNSEFWLHPHTERNFHTLDFEIIQAEVTPFPGSRPMNYRPRLSGHFNFPRHTDHRRFR